MRIWLAFAVWIGLCSSAFADAKDDLALLPLDSDIVGGLDLTKLQKSAVWKKYVEPVLGQGDIQKGLNEFKTTCGLDPLKLATRIVVGMKQVAGGTPDAVLVVHGMPRSKLSACLAKPNPELKRDGDVYVATPKDGQPLAFKFIDADTAVGVLGANATAAGVRAAVKGSGIKSSQAFMDLFKATNTGETVWLIANGNAKMFDTMASSGMRPKAVFGSITLAADVSAALRMRLDSVDKATQFATMMQGQVAQAQNFFDKLVVGSTGADVTFAIALSNAKLDNLVKLLGGVVGGGP